MNLQNPMRFHRHHGSNIVLDPERVTATREACFHNALTFSEKPLLPGEIFLVEIQENETEWLGSIRVGLTQMKLSLGFPLPPYALPDLVSMGPSWLYEITKFLNVYSTQRREEDFTAATNEPQDLVKGLEANSARPRFVVPPLLPLLPVVVPDVLVPEGIVNGQRIDGILQEAWYNYIRPPKVIQKEGSLVRTPRGYVQLRALLPKQSKERLDDYGGLTLLATDVGSRIGVMYVPTAENMADMHIIINGEKRPYALDIPYQTAPIFAAVDVYGSTKKNRIIQLNEVETLQSMCRDVILKSIRLSGVSTLPLPPTLKDYLLYNV